MNKHLIIVGGASNLYINDNKQWYDLVDPAFQKKVKGSYDLYYMLQDDHSVPWTFVSPAQELTTDAPKYNYNIGGDYMLFNDKNQSKVSIYDLADLLIKSANQSDLFHKRITLANR